MRDDLGVRITGLADLKQVLRELPEKLRKQAVRSALRKAARVIQKQAQANAPVLQTPSPYRTPGTVKKRIAVRASKFARKAGNEGVFVGVRPLPGNKYRRVKTPGGQSKYEVTKRSERGAYNPNDPFYWWFVEFGTKRSGRKRKGPRGQKLPARGPGMKARRFLTRAADTMGAEAIRTFMDSVIPQINKLNKRK